MGLFTRKWHRQIEEAHFDLIVGELRGNLRLQLISSVEV
jgi:hypothetical protein